MTDEVILQVKDLKTYFTVDEGVVKAVDGVSFDLRKGETLASSASRARARASRTFQSST